MNPMMIMAALGAGLLFLMNRGEAAAAPPSDARAPGPVPMPGEAVDPFETPGDDARSVPDLGPPQIGPGLEPYPKVQPGDRNGMMPRVEPKVTPEPKVAPRRGPSIVALTKEPSIR